MKVGDTVFIVADDSRNFHLGGTKAVTKIGKKYFEVEGIFWEKILIDRNSDHPVGGDGNRGVRKKGDFSSGLYWWPSKEVYEKDQEAISSRSYIRNNLYLLDDDEAIDFAKLLAEREVEKCGTL